MTILLLYFSSAIASNYSFFWISTVHEQKAHFVISSILTSQKWNLRIQIGQVLQFCIRSISAKYHIFRLHIFERETFGSFDFLIGHKEVTWLVTIETLNPKYFWNLVLLLVSVSETYFYMKQSDSPKSSKNVCVTGDICKLKSNYMSSKKTPQTKLLSFKLDYCKVAQCHEFCAT